MHSYDFCDLLFTFVLELSFEYGWSNLVVYCLCVGIFTMGVLCIYADVFHTVIVLQVNGLFVVLEVVYQQ